MRAFGFFALCMGVLISGCSEDEVGTDTPAADSGLTDTAIAADSGLTDTAIAVDSATPDSATPDSATPDSATDSTTPDSATDSTTATEAGADSGAADSTVADAADSATADVAPDTASADVGTMSFASDIQPIFSAQCTGCHSGAAASAGMSLATGVAYASLVNVNVGCDLTGLKRVLPGSTANSMLWRKLANDPTRCGSAMPLGTAGLKTLDPVAFAKIGAWIAQGAPNN